jgi:uncharacterized membrane protein
MKVKLKGRFGGKFMGTATILAALSLYNLLGLGNVFSPHTIKISQMPVDETSFSVHPNAWL